MSRPHIKNQSLYLDEIGDIPTRTTVFRLLKYMRAKWLRILLAALANVLVTVLTIASMYLMGLAVDNYIAQFSPHALAKLCLSLVTLFIFTSTASYLDTRIMAKVAQEVSFTLRKELYQQLVHSPLTFFDNHLTGDVMSRFTNDVDNVNRTLSQSFSALLENGINLIGMLIAMLLLSPVLTFWTLLIIPITLISLRLVLRLSKRYFRQLQSNLGDMNAYTEEMISAQKTLLLYQQQNHEMTAFQKINQKLATTYMWAQALVSLQPLMNFIQSLSYLLVTSVGAMYIFKDHYGLTVGILFSFLLYMRRFARPLNEISALLNTIQSAIAGAERIFSILDLSAENDDGLVAYQFKGGKIEYRHVSFAYENSNNVLHDISFVLPEGQTLALVGATGSGKTTIANLLNRFYDPSEGDILLDGQNLKTLSRKSVRAQLALVLQDTFLFEDTVMANIRYVLPNPDDVTDEEVFAAARAANADGFIRSLPKGYQTIITDGGANLSHGQQQLLAISRAILANAHIMVLDEATSSIDTQTEKLVQKAIHSLSKQRTTIIIAHRLSTVRQADIILVIDNGIIIEQGNHDTLMAKNGHYAKMLRAQNFLDDNETVL